MAKRQVPTYTINELSAKNSDYCVIPFVINEGERVRAQLKKMRRYAKAVDIIMADGGSTDGSLESSFLKDQKVRALLTKTGPGKLSAQMRMGFDYALNQGYKGVIVVDGNNKDDISAIPEFMKKLEEGYDHIQGSRYIPGGHAINTPTMRHWGLKLLHAPLISLASRTKQTDTTNGFRAYSATLLSDDTIAVFRDIFETYELHYHLAIAAPRNGFKTVEIPVTRKYPKEGKTPTKIGGWRGNAQILKLLFSAALGGYNKK